ncbi:NAD(+) diphosphatase [Denitratimonas sp. CY0512]|uniref:NAD(+) diphosphatase n=1 Tax=Denitratimonas sp. CY0512 TaxID=3131940 RepID=UPI0030990AC7
MSGPQRHASAPAAELSLRNHFAGLALDRAELTRLSPDALRACWPQARVIVLDFEGHALGDDAGLHSWSGQELGEELLEAASFLGQNAGETAWFALPIEYLPELPRNGAQWIGLRHAAALWPGFDSGLFAYAKALLLWQSRARHCGACGAATQLVRAGHCARCRNPACAMQQFPRTDAAIIVLVRDADRALFGRQRNWPEKRWSTLAGFVEPGESLEDAVRREVDEEAGVTLRAVHYHSSQPWPFPGALMVGFHADVDNPEIRVGDELEDACWFGAAELVQAVREGDVSLPPPISISRRLIEDWLLQQLGAEALADLGRPD